MNPETKVSLAGVLKFAGYILAAFYGWSVLNQGVEARLTALETTANNAKLADIPSTLSRIEQKLDSLDRDQERGRK